MKRFTPSIAITALLTTVAPATFAETTMKFDDVAVVQGYVGSEVYTSDGKLFGVLSDIDIDGSQAAMIVDPADGVLTNSRPIFVTVDEGNASVSDGRVTLAATEEKLKLGMSGGQSAAEPAQILLVE